jgi:phenylalanyl-tRNA synthetase beta subunit
LEKLISLELFDIYKVNSEQGAGREGALGYKDVENNKKSFGFKFIFQSLTETLTDELVNEEMDKIYNLLKEKGFETR